MSDAIRYWALYPVWLMLPALVGNIVPLFIKKIPFLSTPVDFGRTAGGKRIFGDHKTWRGLLAGTFAGALTALIQGRLPAEGAALGGANMIGDLWGAYVKRRKDIAPGDKSLVIDALPGPVTALITAWVLGINRLDIIQSGVVLLAVVPLHLLFNTLWYRLGMKRVPW